MDYKEKVKAFKHELSLMGNKDILDFTKECIRVSPDYVFEDCPSSSSSKFHPIDELGGDGTIIHTRRVFTMAYDLSRGLGCENHRDEVCSASILHDLAKQGLMSCGHTIKEHPQIMANLISEVYNGGFKSKLDKKSANIIYWSVFFHYGPWTIKKYNKPLDQFTPEEYCVYLADYTASRRFVKVDYQRKEGLSI